MKKITLLGGSGYVGRSCIKNIVKLDSNCLINVVSRSDKLDLKSLDIGEDVNRIKLIKADALHPETFKQELIESTGIIHSIGVLLSLKSNNDPKSYYSTEFLTAKNAIDCILNNKSSLNPIEPMSKRNFVYISADRGLPFPLSLAFNGYIKYKREAEKYIFNHIDEFKPYILRAGVITDNNQKPFLYPIEKGSIIINKIEENILNRFIGKSITEKMIPSYPTKLDHIGLLAAKGALGLINDDYGLEEKNVYNSKEIKQYAELI